MKTLLSILNGGSDSPRLSIRTVSLTLMYALGLFVVLLQLRSML